MISAQVTFIIFLCCSIAHYVIAAVMALFARHQVKYLSIAWIMGIFATAMLIMSHFGELVATGSEPGILHPYALMAVMSICYLQSIYPLSIPMPGYLQWGRMWRYASPAIVLILAYLIAIQLGSRPVIIHTVGELRQHLLSSDLLMRVAMMLVSFWYIVNIFRLPYRQTHVEFPRYLVGYSTMLGVSVIFYLAVSVDYDARLMMAYVVIFTFLNLYLCFRTLETTALELPRPVIEEVSEAPTDEQLQKAEPDFNEVNLQRFHRVEYWMQHHAEVWADFTFNRDVLCRETGLNRHKLLECLRSQGYNNAHDYINSYRIDELKRRISAGKVQTVTDCLPVGFATIKTARSCFLKHEGQTLDTYLQARSGSNSVAKRSEM